MTLDKQTILDQIKVDIINENICPDLAQEAKNLVMGHGNPNSSIFFIGEAPGKNEDEQGIPFVGASGKFLDQMLSGVNLHREDVYITNIVKYRPPKNRDPSKKEKDDFLPFLTRELDAIKPKLVVTLGRHSMDYFLPDKKISEVHGQIFKTNIGRTEVSLLPLFHPAAALYNGSLKKTLQNDFLVIKELI